MNKPNPTSPATIVALSCHQIATAAAELEQAAAELREACASIALGELTHQARNVQAHAVRVSLAALTVHGAGETLKLASRLV